MSGVRPIVEADLEQVVSLYERAMRSGTQNPPPGLAGYFRRVFLHGPGLRDGLRPLVYEAKGRIQGFIGLHVRPFRFEGEPATLACSGPLFTEPDARLAGAYLMKAVLDGPQLLTVTDGATPDAVKLWERIGGRTNGLASLRWTRIFRPSRLASAYLARRGRVGRLWRHFDLLGRPVWAASDAVARAVGFRAPGRPAELRGEDLDAARLVEGLAALAPHYRLHAGYDAATGDWLLREMRFVGNRGPLRARLLRDAEGGVVGWHVYYAPPGRIGTVVQVAALPRAYEAVLGDLLSDADAQGLQAIQGRLEARLVGPLRDLGARLHYDASFSLIHSRDPRVCSAVFGGDALLSRFDGEWYFGFQGLPLAEA